MRHILLEPVENLLDQQPIEEMNEPVIPGAKELTQNSQTVSSFAAETHLQLVQEKDKLESDCEQLEKEVIDLSKLSSEKREMEAKVKEILGKEKEYVERYQNDIEKIKEELRSGEIYLINMNRKKEMIEAENARLAEEQEKEHGLIMKDIEQYKEGLKLIQEEIDELTEERDELASKLQAKEDLCRYSEMEKAKMIQNIQFEIDEKKDVKGEKIQKMMEQNLKLKQTLQSIESERKKISEVNKKLEADRVNLEKRMQLLQEDNKRYMKEAKDVKFAKNTTNAVLEKKLVMLEQEMKALEKDNEKMRKELLETKSKKDAALNEKKRLFDQFGVDDFDGAVAVRAKPRLFGEGDG